MKLTSLTKISPSATVALNALAQEKKQKGEIVWNLTVGEPVLSTSSLIEVAAFNAMRAGKTLYPPVQGIPELRTAVTTWMNENYFSQFQKENCLVTCGGKHGLLMVLQSLLEQGDEALILAPYWVSYPSLVELCGAKPVIVDTQEKEKWKVSSQNISAACTSKTKLLILNNGSNPTGVLYTQEEVRQILQVAKEKNIVVISDEVYSGLTYDKNVFVSASSFEEYKDNVVIIQSCSKHFAMTGWRVGFVFAPKEIIDACTMFQSQSTTGTSSISQWAALAAFENAKSIQAEICTEMEHRRNNLIENFKKYFGVSLPAPSAGLYIFLPLSLFGTKENSEEFCRRVLEQANVVLVPGSAFGKEGYVRASFGGKVEEVEGALSQLSKMCRASGT